MRGLRRVSTIGALMILVLTASYCEASPMPFCVTPPENTSQRALLKALEERDRVLALKDLALVPDLNFENLECFRPLDLAIRMQDIVLIQAMLDRGAKPKFNAAENTVYSANSLGYADVDTIRILSILTPVITPADTSSALRVAAKHRRHQLMSWLVAHGADIYQVDRCDLNDDTLQVSIDVNDPDGVALLLDAGAKLDGKDRPLVSAVLRGNPMIVKILLDRGASLKGPPSKSQFIEDNSPMAAAVTMQAIAELFNTEGTPRIKVVGEPPRYTSRDLSYLEAAAAAEPLIQRSPSEGGFSYREAARNYALIVEELRQAGAQPEKELRDPQIRNQVSCVP